MSGLITIFTGEGKGKTSAALGMLLRATCAGMKVAWIAWYKDPSWAVSEYRIPELLPGVAFFPMGKGFSFGKEKTGPTEVRRTKTGAVVDTASHNEHVNAAVEALHKAKEIITSKQYDLVILDECVQAAGDGLLDEQELLSVLSNRGETHVVLTGRHCPQSLQDIADTVTSMEKVKHAYDQGILAVKGLDF